MTQKKSEYKGGKKVTNTELLCFFHLTQLKKHPLDLGIVLAFKVGYRKREKKSLEIEKLLLKIFSKFPSCTKKKFDQLIVQMHQQLKNVTIIQAGFPNWEYSLSYTNGFLSRIWMI